MVGTGTEPLGYMNSTSIERFEEYPGAYLTEKACACDTASDIAKPANTIMRG